MFKKKNTAIKEISDLLSSTPAWLSGAQAQQIWSKEGAFFPALEVRDASTKVMPLPR